MMPQAITNTGPYAGVWSDLKSMRHALERVMRAQTINDIQELDIGRLKRLAEFMRSELDPKPIEDAASLGEFLTHASSEPCYSLDVDLRTLLKELPTFVQWHRLGKLGFKEKSMKLTTALEEHVDKLSGKLFPENPPQEEFGIIYEALAKLLLQTETAMFS